MKQLTKYTRIASYLDKIYNRLNVEFFNNEMERPVITIQSSPRSYGSYSLYDAWTVGENGSREINIGAGTLSRNIENVIATLLHEMYHQYNDLNKISDTSRNFTYHNKNFKKTAESHGLLIISRSETYGWTITEPSEKLIDWILENDFTDIPMNRNEFDGFLIGGNGGGRSDGDKDKPIRKGSYRKHTCPACGLTARTTREARLSCMECGVEMEREG
jgi:hypothetical protein